MTHPNYQFVPQPAMREYDFARFLARHDALDTWHTIGRMNTWFAPDGKPVALCIYSGKAGMITNYCIRADLALQSD